jgi:hypothetical protein
MVSRQDAGPGRTGRLTPGRLIHGRCVSMLVAAVFMAVAVVGCSADSSSGDAGSSSVSAGGKGKSDIAASTSASPVPGGSLAGGRGSGGTALDGPDETPAWLDVDPYADQMRDALPPAGVSERFAAVSAENRDSEVDYLSEFVTRLLTVDYAEDSREELLAWARSEAAASPSTDPEKITPEDAVVYVTSTLVNTPLSRRSGLPRTPIAFTTTCCTLNRVRPLSLESSCRVSSSIAAPLAPASGTVLVRARPWCLCRLSLPYC